MHASGCCANGPATIRLIVGLSECACLEHEHDRAGGWPGMSAKARRATADATRILWTMTVANYCLTVGSASSAFLAIDATLPGGVSASAMTTSLASGDRRWLLSKFVSAPLHCSRLVMSLPFLLRL